MAIDPSMLPQLTQEEIDELREKYPEKFLELCRLMADLHLHLARTDINWFVPYVLRVEGKDEPVVQGPHHVALQRHIDANQFSLIWGGVGIGKAQPFGSKVLTPAGAKRIEHMAVGDLVVDPMTNATSTVAKIIGPTNDRIVRFVTASGRAALCAVDHNWVVQVDGEKQLLAARSVCELRRTHEVKVPVYLRSGKIVWDKLDAVYTAGFAHCLCLVLDGGSRLYVTDGGLVTHNCVTADTLFVDESWRPITAVELAQLVSRGARPKVLDIDPKTLRQEFVPVVSAKVDETVPIYEIASASRSVVKVSGNHPILAEKVPGAMLSFVDAQDLAPWSRVVTAYPRIDEWKFNRDWFSVGVFLGGASAYLKRAWVMTAQPAADPDPKYILMSQQASAYIRRLSKEPGGFPFKTKPSPTRQDGLLALWPDAIQGLSLEYILETRTRSEVWYRHKVMSARRVMMVKAPRWAYPSIVAGILAVVVKREQPRANRLYVDMPHVLAEMVLWMLRCVGIPCGLSYKRGCVTTLCFGDLYAEGFLDMIAQHVDHLRQHAIRLIQLLHVGAAKWQEKLKNQRDTIMTYGLTLGSAELQGAAVSKRTSFVALDPITRISVGQPAPTYAIEVDSPRHTFLTDWTLTHNTQQVTIARSLFWLGQNPNARILIIMASQNNHAKDVLRQIKSYITSSEAYHAVFPHVRPGSKWAEFEIMIERTEESVTPSIRIAGISTSIIGSRFDFLIGDDFLDRDNTSSASERENVYRALVSTPLSRLTGTAKAVLIGNAWNADDAMHRLERMPGTKWAPLRIPARDPKTGQTRFPDIISQSQIDTWIRTRPPGEVRRALDCVPWTNDSSRYRIEWFRDALAKGCGAIVEDGVPALRHTRYDLVEAQEKAYAAMVDGKPARIPVIVVAGIDQGFGQSERSDLTAVAVGVMYSDDTFLLIDYKAGRLSEAEKVAEVVRLHECYGATIFVETTFTQKWFYEHVRRVAPDIAIFPWNTRGSGEVGNKHHAQFGVASLEVLFSTGKIILPSIPSSDSETGYATSPEIASLIDAFMAYEPDSWTHTHDGIMAMWIMTQGARLRYDVGSFSYSRQASSASLLPGQIDTSSIWGANTPWESLKKRLNRR